MSRRGFKDRKVRLSQRDRKRQGELDHNDPRIRQGCTRKNVYWTKTQAREGARSIGERYGKELTYYRCQFARHYHLTKAEDEPTIEVLLPATLWPPTLISLVGTIIKPMVRRIA